MIREAFSDGGSRTPVDPDQGVDGWFDALFRQSDVAKVHVDDRGCIAEANRAFVRFLGYEAGELTGTPICQLGRPEHVSSMNDAYERLLNTPCVQMECVFVTKDGSDRAVEVTSHRIDGEQGRSVMIELRDAAPRMALMQEVREMKALLEGIQRLGGVGYWSFAPADGVITWSEEVYRIFDASPGEQAPTFDAYTDRIHPADRDRVLELIQRALDEGEPYTMTHRLVLHDVSIRWVVCSGDIVRDEDGNAVKLIGTIQDITEYQEALDATRDSEQRLRFHIEHSPMAYIEWDMNFEVVEWNAAAERMFGYTREEALGVIPPIVPEDEQEKVAALVEALLAGKGGQYSVNVNTTKAGERITCEWFNTSLRSRENEIIGISSIVQDITLRMEAERALLNYATELKHARDAAESATKAKSAFLANMSHEIRTPLNGVIGMASLLSETDLSQEQKDYLSTIQISSESLLTIINDILDFSKIEAGKIELEHIPVNLREAIESSLDLLATRAAENRLELLYTLHDDVPACVITDPTRLRQILVNLLSNAVKFTTEGEIEIGATLLEEGGESRLHVYVRDTGIGIPKDKLNRLFQSFSQVDTSTTRKYGGTGLGLSISSRLAELMGGGMWVESEVGIGTTFHFTIALEPANEGPATPAFTVARSVLLLDEHARSRALLTRRLDAMNLAVTACASAAEAARLVQLEAFHALVIGSPLDAASEDVLANALARREAGLPVLAAQWLSLDSPPPSFATCVLNKPMRYGSLYDKLGEAMAQHPGDAAEPAPLRVAIAERNPIHSRLLARFLNGLCTHVDAVSETEALEAAAAAEYDLILVGIEHIEAAIAANPDVRLRDRSVTLAALANQLEAAHWRTIASHGIDDVVALPVQAGDLRRLVARAADRVGDRVHVTS